MTQPTAADLLKTLQGIADSVRRLAEVDNPGVFLQYYLPWIISFASVVMTLFLTLRGWRESNQATHQMLDGYATKQEELNKRRIALELKIHAHDEIAAAIRSYIEDVENLGRLVLHFLERGIDPIGNKTIAMTEVSRLANSHVVTDLVQKLLDYAPIYGEEVEPLSTALASTNKDVRRVAASVVMRMRDCEETPEAVVAAIDLLSGEQKAIDAAVKAASELSSYFAKVAILDLGIQRTDITYSKPPQ